MLRNSTPTVTSPASNPLLRALADVLLDLADRRRAALPEPAYAQGEPGQPDVRLVDDSALKKDV